MESGDTWFNNPDHGGPDFGPLFGVDAVYDGNVDDVNNLVGEPGSIMDGISTDYWGYMYYPDWLTATGSGVLALSNDDPEYGVMVTQDTGTYQTVAFSLEMSGIGSGKLDVLMAILGFFGL
jgi:hypothetical protein